MLQEEVRWPSIGRVSLQNLCLAGGCGQVAGMLDSDEAVPWARKREVPPLQGTEFSQQLNVLGGRFSPRWPCELL